MILSTTEFNQQLCEFLDASPTPFHAVETMKTALVSAGFTSLAEKDSWGTLQAGKYFVTRNDSSIIAFTLSGTSVDETGFNMVGAHTDSPCLRVKPKPEQKKFGLAQLGVEVYGGVLLHPWFDRDLSMAGRVHFEDSNGQLKHTLIDFKKAVAVIPSLAIHLDREANNQHTVNPQLHLPPILAQFDEGDGIDFRALLEQQLRTDTSEMDVTKVLDYEISFYDTQKASVMGLADDFIASARLDNLLSCFTGLASLLEASVDNKPAMLICTDHEEVGSRSACGANGSFLQSVLQRLAPTPEAYQRMVERSTLISADNAHGVHPNYADKHDASHGPLLNKGPVIKTNANQSYATNSETSAMFRQLCEQADVPVQDFVTRTDMGCGSTIGPITASAVGVKTIDVGVPTFAMHSIRELAGCEDASMLYRVFNLYFAQHS
jgi:aspartyl aminopeptidase